MPSYAERIAFAARLAYGRWQPPAVTPAQTWEGFPDWWTSPDDGARDAIGAGLAYVFTQVASDAARMSTMHLRKHARGWALDLVAAAAGIARQGDERDGALRARIAVIEDAVSADAVRAAQLLIEPRVRLWPVATGVVKPYALAGFTTMLYDSIVVPDSAVIDYPNSAAGAVLGVTGGGGLALDVNDFFTLQLEVPFTWMLPEGPQERIDPLVKTAPQTVGQYGYVLRGTGAIAVRF